MKKTYSFLLLAFISCTAFAQVNLQQGLGAYYPFDGNANDSSGNGNHGTEVGVNLANDRNSNANSAYFFDGQDHYINVPASSSVQPQNAISVAAWVNTSDKDWWNFAVCKRLNLAVEPGNSYFLGATGAVPGGSTWQWSISDATTQHFLVSNTLVEDSVWLHLVGTFDGDTLKLHLNGQNIGSKVISHATISYSTLSLRLGLGIPTSSGSKTSWNGYMDEIRIYDRELTSDEIKYLYNPSLLSTGKLVAEKIEVKAFPNPANNRVFLSSETARDVLGKSEITISDVTGKQVIKTVNSTEGIDISGLKPGVYFIQVASFNSALKFIKE